MSGDARQLRIDLAVHGAEGPFSVRTVAGVDRVSAAFRYLVEFTAHADTFDLDDILTSEVNLTLVDAGDIERVIHGVVEEASVLPSRWNELPRFELTLVPEPALLQHRHGSRVFVDASVPDICRDVFERAGLPRERFDWRLSGAYPSREICIQYDEDEWSFVCRLLEDEGIHFRFEHDAEGHRMVFEDDSTRAPLAEPDVLPFQLHAHGDVLYAHAFAFEDTAELCVDRVELADLDEIRPGRDLRFSESGESVIGREWYEFPGGFTDEEQGRRLARARLEELRAPQRVIHLGTTAFAALAGQRIVVVGADIDIPDAFIIESRIDVSQHSDEEWRATNDLTLIPDRDRYRPARATARPLVHGLHTARVTGPAGAESHVDDLGRVKLQFHFDREGQLDDRSSCWVPVSHGHTTGAIMHPRVGWEVVVEFRDGDPDKPVVTGRVYNPLWPPPHALPERKTVTAHRSDSLPGREKINEVRFEDLAGHEHIAVTAGHDLRQVVIVDRKITVHHDENREVGAHRVATIGVLQKAITKSNYSDSVTLAQNIQVGKDRSVLIRKSASQVVQRDITQQVGNLRFAQVGEDVPGALQARLRQSSEGPAQVLMESLEEFLSEVSEAVGDEASEAGAAQQLLEEEEPSPTSTLGQVMGSLDEPPDAPPDHSAELGTSLGDTIGELGRAGGEIAEGVGEAVEGVGEIVEGAEALADGVQNVDELAGAVGDIAGGVGGAVDGAGGIAGGLEGVGDSLGEASFMQEEAWLSDVAGALGELGEASEAVKGGLETAGSVTKIAGKAAALAGGAAGLIDDPGADDALKVLSAVGSALSDDADSEPPSTKGREEPAQAPDFLADLMGGGDAQTAWDVSTTVIDNLDSTIAAMSGVIDGFGALFQDASEGVDLGGGLVGHPYEHNAVHFGAAVADAIFLGRLGSESEEEDDEGGSEPDEDADSRSEPDETDSPSEDAATEDGEPESEEAEHPESGEGSWSSSVGGNAIEYIAGVVVTGAGEGFRLGVGGRSTEVARLARVEQVGDNRLEETAGSKTESTGRYVVVAAEGITHSSDGAVRTVVNGDATLTVGGALTLESGGDLLLSGNTLELGGEETVVFECGAARVSISSDGIAIEGTEIVVRADVIGVDSPALG